MAGHLKPPTDADRVIGQIQRGEVTAGPEGARRIAARHEAAYGRSVWPATDTSRTEEGTAR